MAEERVSVKGEAPYLDFNLWLILKIGVWNDHGLMFRMTWFTIYGFGIYIFVLVGTITQVYTAFNDVPIITESLSAFMSYGMNCQKLLHLIIYEKEFKYLMRLVKNNFFNELQKNNPEHHKMLLKRDRESKILTYFFGSFVFTCVMFFSIQPMVKVIFHKDDVNGTCTVNWTFPWRFQLPFDTSSSLVYWLVYAYHCTISWFHVLAIPGCDNFYIALLNHVYGQCIILRENLENLYENTFNEIKKNRSIKSRKPFLNIGLNNNNNIPVKDSLEDGTGYEEDLYRDGDRGGEYFSNMETFAEADDEFHEEMKRQLKDCIMHHKTILDFVNQLELVMNKPMLSQFFTSTIVLCTTAFQILMFSTDTAKLLGMLSFLTGEMVQLFMYCYFADLITTETGNVGKSAYFSQWQDASPGVKRSILIVMTRSQKATLFTVGKFADLSLHTFAGVLKASYTYLMMLIEMSDGGAEQSIIT